MPADPPRAPRKRDPRYSSTLWRKVREQVRNRDGHVCRACNRREPLYSQSMFPVDHRTPPERGGEFYDKDNLWLLCWSCNTSKGGLTVEEWYAQAGKAPSPEGITRFDLQDAGYGPGEARPVNRRRDDRFAFPVHRHLLPGGHELLVGDYQAAPRGWDPKAGCPVTCDLLR